MEIKVERLGINGEGIGIIKEGENAGKIVFIKNALPNEIVDIDIIKNAKSFCIGRVTKFYKESDKRIIPKCKYYGVCGGCQLQHMNDNLQKELKIENVKSTIKKIAGLDVDITSYVSDKSFNYRNKMVFPIGCHNGKAFIGMFKEDSHIVTPIQECLLSSVNINKILGILGEYISSNFKGYSFTEKRGDIKYIVIREHLDSILLTFVTTKKIQLNGLYEILCKHVKNIGISTIISDSDDEIISGKYTWNNGLKNLQIEEFGIRYNIDNRGFLQVNDTIKEKLYSSVLSQIDKNDIVFDGYSGAGLLTAIISKSCKKVIGVEINHSACESARELIKSNNLTNIDYYEGDVKDYLESFKDANKVILDPPRSGCDKYILESLLSMDNIQDIIYISCNPSTLARDLGILKNTYNIVNIELYNMFPNTKHVETLVYLRKKTVVHNMKLKEDPFEMIKSGKKTIELRLFDDKRKQIKIGDNILFTNIMTSENLLTKVENLHYFNNFKELYENLPLLKCGYTEENVNSAKSSDMEAYYSTSEQMNYGVVGIELSLLND